MHFVHDFYPNSFWHCCRVSSEDEAIWYSKLSGRKVLSLLEHDLLFLANLVVLLASGLCNHLLSVVEFLSAFSCEMGRCCIILIILLLSQLCTLWLLLVNMLSSRYLPAALGLCWDSA